MTPHKAGGRGTFILDRRTRIGRIAVASGTTHAPTFRRLNEMITTLDETGRGDLLRQIRDGLAPLTVYEAFRTNELHKLPTAIELKPLRATLEKWLDDVECGVRQKAAHRTMVNCLGRGAVADLPSNLVEYRGVCKKARTPAQFNRVKMSALSFVRDTMKRSHRIYGELQDIPIMREKKAPRKQPQTWERIAEIAESFEDRRDRRSVYGMALTGMRPKEWFIDGWQVLPDRVLIFGEKRSSSRRSVPRLRPGLYMIHVRPADCAAPREMRRFGERLYEKHGIHSYDLRRSFANWMESARIVRTRRKLYIGHKKSDVTDLYEEHEVDAFLKEDAERLERYLAETPITTPITLVSGESDR